MARGVGMSWKALKLVVLVTAVALAVAVDATATTGPSLRVVARTPLVLEGRGFHPQEHVTVTVITGLGPRVARAVAVRGTFKVSLRVRSSGCGGAYAVRAAGNLGSRAMLLLGKSICVPPPRD